MRWMCILNLSNTVVFICMVKESPKFSKYKLTVTYISHFKDMIVVYRCCFILSMCPASLLRRWFAMSLTSCDSYPAQGHNKQDIFIIFR